jgi:predicted lipid-binding transport protein (Tim44 family)
MTRPISRTVGVAALLALCACTNSGYGAKQTVGALAGAGLGGLAGASLFDGDARIAGAAAGTLLGAWLGNEAGKSLDRADAAYASGAEAHALEYPPGPPRPGATRTAAATARSRRSIRTRPPTATAVSSSTRPRSAAGLSRSTAPPAAAPTANGR